MKKILTQSFFNRPTLKVAEDLLGKYIVRRVRDKETALQIYEVESYDGFLDKASHAHKGRTQRTEIMFGDAGYFYIYLVYGMYYMLNIVTHKKDYPAAILIRGAGEYDGPGKLSAFLKINKKLNGKKSERKSGLWFEDRGANIPKKSIKKTPRIGVDYAGTVWANKPYRFVLKK